MRDTFARTLYTVGKENPKVIIVVADISPAGSMHAFRSEFPDRFVNVGVAEQNMIGLCAGAALRGLKPYAYTIGNFAIYRPFEFIRNDLCYQHLPVTVVGIGGGVTYSTLGATHHTQEDIGVMSSIPNMTIIAPCDPLEVEHATWYSAKSDHPLYLRLGKAGEPTLTADAIDAWEFGKIRYLRQGRDVCIISYGPIMKMASEVAAELEKNGQSTALVACHTLKPLDKMGLAKILLEYSQVVVIEEHSEVNGLGAKLKELAWEVHASCKLQTFSLKDEFIHCHASHAQLLQAHGLDTGMIVRALQS